MTEQRYTAGSNSANQSQLEVYENCGNWCVSGPGDGFGYYSWTQHPERQFHSLDQAEVVAKMLDEAFREGMRHQQKKMRGVLGL